MAKQTKLPALQFYPGDWRKSVDVQSLSFHDRGVWFEMLMLMHDSERRGVLMLNGNAMPDEMIARALGLDNQTFNQTLTTLLTFGVASREPETGAIMSRRMVRDEDLRRIRQLAGSMGGNPALLDKQNPTTGDKQIPTPSSSSSSSLKTKTKTKTKRPAPKAQELIPSFIDQEAWDAYVEMRKKKRCPMTPRARELIIAKLEEFRAAGDDPNEALNQSVMNGYQGVFPPRGGNGNGTNKPKWDQQAAFDEGFRQFDQRYAAANADAGDGGLLPRAEAQPGNRT